MLADVVRYLRCPVCGGALAETGRALHCPAGHSFDRARAGYVQLSAGPLAHNGDTAAMVEARSAFLAGGHYRFIADALAEVAAGTPVGGLVVEVGAGTGYHLSAVLDACPDALGLALDASQYASRRAARAHRRAAAIRCDVWRAMPLASGCAALLIDVFAPRNGAEFARVLAGGGRLLVVTPTAEHLAELVPVLGMLRVDPEKEDRTAAGLGPWFERRDERACRATLRLSRRQVSELVAMGPSAWHSEPDRRSVAIADLSEPVAVTASVRLASYHRIG